MILSSFFHAVVKIFFLIQKIKKGISTKGATKKKIKKKGFTGLQW
jgi:hypothetical protein